MAKRKFYSFILLIVPIILCSCILEKDSNNVSKYNIKEKEQLRWAANFNGHKVDINGYVFPFSPNIKKTADERKIFQDERLQSALKRQKSAPTKDLRESYRKEIEQIQSNRDPWYGVANWTNWPVVLASYVFTTKAKPAKLIVICQHKDKNIDLVFTILCSGEMTYPDSLELIQKITEEEFDHFNKEQWGQLPLQKHQVDDPNLAYMPKEIREFLNDSVFLKQH